MVSIWRFPPQEVGLTAVSVAVSKRSPWLKVCSCHPIVFWRICHSFVRQKLTTSALYSGVAGCSMPKPQYDSGSLAFAT